MAAPSDGLSPPVVAPSGNGAAPADDGPQGAATPPAPSSARDFLRSLETAFGRLTTLKVVTVVGDVSVSGTGQDMVLAARPGALVEAASTEVNLLDAHIVNVFSAGFAGTSGTLQSFHQSQVEKSRDIMLSNLAELQKLASALASMRR